MKELAEQAKAGFTKAEEEWEKSGQAWNEWVHSVFVCGLRTEG
jgi:hypothetical protein